MTRGSWFAGTDAADHPTIVRLPVGDSSIPSMVIRSGNRSDMLPRLIVRLAPANTVMPKTVTATHVRFTSTTVGDEISPTTVRVHVPVVNVCDGVNSTVLLRGYE